MSELALVSDPIAAGARWITSAEHRRDGKALPIVATVVNVPEGIRSAKLSIACLGVLHCTIDGTLASGDVLEPGYADWSREAEFTEWDVTSLLTPGSHVLRCDLGPGMYRSLADDERWVKITTDYGDIAVALALTIEHAGGTDCIVSDSSWHGTVGATVHSGFIGGEDYDASLEPGGTPLDVRSWPAALEAVVPAVDLVAKSTAPIRIVETLTAQSVTRVGDEFVVDFGVNSAGWCVIDLPARAKVRLRPAELLLDDGSVDVRTQGWGPVFHTVRTAETPLTWRPRFMYVGMRYLEVSGLEALETENVRFEVLAAGVPESGAFSASDERLNAIWQITKRAITSNMFSVFTDCPQREKLGYLEQVHLLYPLLTRTYSCENILDRMLDLALGSQRADGSIGLYAPAWQEFPDPWRGDPNWGGIVVELALARWLATGSPAFLERSFESMLRYTQFLLDDRDPDGILRYGLGDFNGASVQKFRNVPFVSTASLHRLLVRTTQAATILERHSEAKRLTAAAGEVASAFDAAFGPIASSDRSVAELVFAVHASLAPTSTIDRIDQMIIDDEYVLDVGEVAMAHLVGQLAAAGKHETLLGITRVTDAPSYGYMLAHGATTLTETWDGPTFGFSQNHFMNGAIGIWFHEFVVGIRQRESTVGWQDVLIAPALVGDLTHASGWYEAPTGRIEAAWTRTAGSVTVSGSAPHATVRMPSGSEHQVSGEFSFTEALA